ncbi:hypothetical protein RND81_02G155600 [Saponaria officinalis]|uniref:Homeobox domain-containing protein n=1 Tax=Saponaria officinalis TaxID=3572 RepID=A0AAW1MY76_SAPOF
MNSYDDNSLDLDLGLATSTTTRKTNQKPQQYTVHGGEPTLTLSLSGEKVAVSAASSMSNVVVKREREVSSSDEEEDGSCANININNNSNNINSNNNGSRKKLRLTKDQSAMLEESFKLQSTLNPKQKQALAERLDLQPRQVEVWFQNRRARTKLKQTEVDCEYMKKWCETLSDENKRLQKELQELKALKLAQPFYMHLPSTTLSMCPSCESIGSGVPIIGTPAPVSNKRPLLMASKSHFYPASPNRPLLVDN